MVVLIDGGCEVDGYWSDITRTRYFRGEPSAEFKKVYGVVHDAQSAAIARVRPGVAAEDIDRAARDVIDKAGYGAGFTHRVGHGLGMDGHEPAYLVRGNQQALEPGFVFNKPSEILAIVDGVRGLGNKNFGVLYDTCHAHMVAAVGANHQGSKELLPGGELELLEKLKGKITHLHLIDSDSTLNEHNTSTHNPFGTGKLNFDKLVPALNAAGVPNEWWVVDLCFWPNAWEVTAQSKTFLDGLKRKHAC